MDGYVFVDQRTTRKTKHIAIYLGLQWVRASYRRRPSPSLSLSPARDRKR